MLFNFCLHKRKARKILRELLTWIIFQYKLFIFHGLKSTRSKNKDINLKLLLYNKLLYILVIKLSKKDDGSQIVYLLTAAPQSQQPHLVSLLLSSNSSHINNSCFSIYRGGPLDISEYDKAHNNNLSSSYQQLNHKS